jgi:biotin carboxyl carrier protein
MSGRRWRVAEPTAPDRDPVSVEAPDATGDGAARGVVLGRVGPIDPDGRRSVEVVVDGWRFAFEVEDARRAELRDRATRDGHGEAGADGPLEIRAIIPGRIVAVSVVPGDEVTPGQALLVVEAMKMQNELTAPRAGTVRRVAVGAGSTVDLGDVLVVLG